MAESGFGTIKRNGLGWASNCFHDMTKKADAIPYVWATSFPAPEITGSARRSPRAWIQPLFAAGNASWSKLENDVHLFSVSV